jgi:hypothetical protein
MAEYKLQIDCVVEAEVICQRVAKCRRTILRKRDPTHEESMALLVRIAQAKSQKLPSQAQELLIYGIDMESPTFDGNTELFKAAKDGAPVRVLELLLSLPGVDVSNTCPRGFLAVEYAMIKREHHSYDFLVAESGKVPLSRQTCSNDFIIHIKELLALYFVCGLSDETRDFEMKEFEASLNSFIKEGTKYHDIMHRINKVGYLKFTWALLLT